MAAAGREGEVAVPGSVLERARRRAAPAALAAVATLIALLALLAGPAGATEGPIAWTPCGTGAECGTLDVPRDYADPDGPAIAMPVTRIPASDPEHRIGSLVLNYGGPGAPGAQLLRDTPPEVIPVLAPVVHERYDLVSFDPRGTGGTLPVDCGITAEDGLTRELVRPDTLDVGALVADARRYTGLCAERNPDVLDQVSTADVARDMDRLRAALGEDRLTYLGYSYGSFVGATYESLFPERQGRMVLDGAMDAANFVAHPLQDLREGAAGFERALDRFLAACAADQAACAGFGGSDPWAAFDALVARADAQPIPAATGEPVSGVDLVEAVTGALYAREAWPMLAVALAQAEAGDASIFREVLGIDPYDAEAGAGNDRYIATVAVDAEWPREVEPYLESAREAWGLLDHMWPFAGYENVLYAFWPATAPAAFHGPFRSSPDAPATLVIGTTYDPATPYRWAVGLAGELGNARLLTMRGDGHTAFGSRSSCIDAAVIGYLVEGALPAPGTVCPQEVPFAQPPAAQRDQAVEEGLETLALRMRVAGPWAPRSP
jgi:pimeloyl-ACP methyl ester carboxylesterase